MYLVFNPFLLSFSAAAVLLLLYSYAFSINIYFINSTVSAASITTLCPYKYLYSSCYILGCKSPGGVVGPTIPCSTPLLATHSYSDNMTVGVNISTNSVLSKA